jgi:hypothetical protein
LNTEPAERGEPAGRDRSVVSSATAAASASLVLLAAIFLGVHLPYLPRSLEDLDSINFALGVQQFDVAQHQPHPPGYPVYIAAAKLVHRFVPDVARSLAVLSVLAGSLGVIAIGALFRRLDASLPARWLVAATALAIACPLYWFTAARPLSDMAGLAAAIAVQAATLAAASPRALAGVAFAAGVAAGVRSQVAWLTVPLLIVRGLGSWGPGNWRTPGVRDPAAGRTVAKSARPVVLSLFAFALGILVWFIPLVVITGGPTAYWRVLVNQGAEDIGNISMLWTTHTIRAVLEAFYSAFVAPWANWAAAGAMLTLSLVGTIVLARRNRSSLVLVGAAFGPYLIFDLLFQETFTGRYALPLVVPIAYLAAAALRRLPADAGLGAAVALAMFGAHVSGASIAAYSRQKAPAFRLLDDMAAAARERSEPPVVAFDRRNMFDFRRPLVWAEGALPKFERLPAPPQHEWLEAVHYWNGGGRAAVWFVVDPKRTAIDLVQHGDPERYRWTLPYPDLVSGARPHEMDWYRVERPEWYVGDGWALTPEVAGVSEADRRGLAYGPISGWIARGHDAGTIMIGGRNFEPSRQVRLTISLAGRELADEAVPPGPFLRFLALPNDGDGPEYSTLTIAGETGSRAAVEQFDASAARPLLGVGRGWHEQEFNARTGARWRWVSERGDLELRQVSSGVSLHVEGESPRKYFGRPSRLAIRSGDRLLADRMLGDDFSVDAPLPAGVQKLTLETDQIYVPAERSRRTGDRRRLGLRIFKLELRGQN